MMRKAKGVDADIGHGGKRIGRRGMAEHGSNSQSWKDVVPPFSVQPPSVIRNPQSAIRNISVAGLCCLWLALSLSAAIAAPLPASDAALKPADISLSPWDWDLNLHGAFGYKDNVLLNRRFADGSGFFQGGLDASLLRLPLDGTQLSLLVSAEDTRYWQSPKLDDEQFILSMLQWKQYGPGEWVWSCSLDHHYQNQVMDVSATETNLNTARFQGNGLRLYPGVRRDFEQRRWAELELGASRQWLHAPLDGFWQFRPKFTVGQGYGNRSELSLIYEPFWRWYDHREPLTREGFRIPGETLVFTEHEFQVQWQHYWDPPRHWRTTTRLGFALNLDNGGGYFDFRRYQFTEALRYKSAAWEVRAQVRLAAYEFTHQTFSRTDERLRDKATWQLQLRIEKTWTKHLKTFAQYEHESSLSNLLLDEYNVNTLLAGIDWGW
ncbi:MAG: hypothetical protein WCO56_14575 [Verrucomicrobiota bacterium]